MPPLGKQLKALEKRPLQVQSSSPEDSRSGLISLIV